MSLISSVLLLICYRQEMKTNELTKIVSEEGPGGKDIKTSSVSIKIVTSGLLRGFYHCLIEGVFWISEVLSSVPSALRLCKDFLILPTHMISSYSTG